MGPQGPGHATQHRGSQNNEGSQLAAGEERQVPEGYEVEWALPTAIGPLK
jgi:hypothetical protein